MPQLIAMVIVVVGAMIYMFQTFGGTGDKIEGIAQKTSIVTEINNIKNGLKLAARAEQIEKRDSAKAVSTLESVETLEGLAELAYFPEQVNQQIIDSADNGTGVDNFNIYKAISFGGDDTTKVGDLEISLVNNIAGAIPGIFVDLSKGGLKDNAAFLETQIANDLASIATIDRHAITATANALQTTGSDIDKRTPALTTATATSPSDGMFIIYFNDFGSNEIVINN